MKHEMELNINTINEVLSDDNEYLIKILNISDKWLESENELSQNRTNFQIEKFIIHDNFTIPSAFKSALINRKSVAESLLTSVLDLKRKYRIFNYKWNNKDKNQPIWWKTPEGGEDLCWYDLDEFVMNREIENFKNILKKSIDELEFFDKIIYRLIELNGNKLISKEQYDNDQPNYWLRRLSNQALDDLMQAKTGINAGNIRSMRRASAPTVLEDDVNRTKGSFGDPTQVTEFLEQLQRNVFDGIAEISDLHNKLESSDNKLLLENDNKELYDIELFNSDLNLTGN